MMNHDMLRPVVALVAWTLVMWGWMLAVRLPALRAAGVSLKGLVGGTGADAGRVVPAQAQWPAHNYNHLMEQPTIFYAASLALALAGAGGVAPAFAWAYVGLRVAHSLVQATVNRVLVRFVLFLLSTLCLAVLTVLAAIAVF